MYLYFCIHYMINITLYMLDFQRNLCIFVMSAYLNIHLYRHMFLQVLFGMFVMSGKFQRNSRPFVMSGSELRLLLRLEMRETPTPNMWRSLLDLAEKPERPLCQHELIHWFIFSDHSRKAQLL